MAANKAIKKNKGGRRKNKRGLTPKQEAFVREYLIDLNATQAAIRAGYSKKTAHPIGAENLQKPAIAKAIQRVMDERARKVEVTQERVLREFAKIAFLDPRQFFDSKGRLREITSLPEDVAAGIAGLHSSEIPGKKEGDPLTLVKKIKFADKLKALDSLARHLGMYNDKIKHSFDEEALRAILSALPEEYAQSVVHALSRTRRGG